MTTLQPSYSGGSHVPPHVLVMEDEETVARGLEMVLEEEGYEVDLAHTGEGALKTLSEADFDVLVADLRLPDIDGLEVIRMVKKRRPETAVVVITGYSSVSSAVDAMKIGVADYLSKPFTEEEIKRAIGRALGTLQTETATPEAEPEKNREALIQKCEVMRVLDRTGTDVDFAADLLSAVPGALREYRLNAEAKAAILSGDLKWLKQHVGDLSLAQLSFIYKRLEREDWGAPRRRAGW